MLVGGDGSLHGAANAPLRCLPELALVPGRSREQHCARARIPLEWTQALSVAGRGSARPVDALFVVRRIVSSTRSRRSAPASRRRLAPATTRTTRRTCARASRPSSRAPRLRPLFGSGPSRRGRARSSRGGSGLLLEPSLLRLRLRGRSQRRPGRRPLRGGPAIEATSRRRVLCQLAAAYRGRHLGRRGVRAAERGLRAKLIEPLPLVADSVPLGITTATVTVEPAHRLDARASSAGHEPRAPAPDRLLGGRRRRWRRPRAHDHLPTGAARAHRGRPFLDRGGDDRQRCIWSRGPVRHRRLVRSPIEARPPASRSWWAAGSWRRGASSRSGSATHLVPGSGARCGGRLHRPQRLTTAHRALVADDVEDARRPAATSARREPAWSARCVAVGYRRRAHRAGAGGAFALAASWWGSPHSRRCRESPAPPGSPGRRRLARRPRLASRGAAPRGRARSPPRPDAVGLRLRGAAGVLRPLRRGQPRPRLGIAGMLPLAFGALTAVGMVLGGAGPPRARAPCC